MDIKEKLNDLQTQFVHVCISHPAFFVSDLIHLYWISYRLTQQHRAVTFETDNSQFASKQADIRRCDLQQPKYIVCAPSNTCMMRQQPHNSLHILISVSNARQQIRSGIVQHANYFVFFMWSAIRCFFCCCSFSILLCFSVLFCWDVIFRTCWCDSIYSLEPNLGGNLQYCSTYSSPTAMMALDCALYLTMCFGVFTVC